MEVDHPAACVGELGRQPAVHDGVGAGFVGQPSTRRCYPVQSRLA